METRGIVASWQPQAGSFDVWVSTQSPHDVRTVTSRITGVPENRIRVQMGDVGGGFGQKAYLARDEQIILLASYHLGQPLKWIEDRRENLLAATTSARGAVHGHDRRRRRRHHPRHRGRPPRRRRRVSDSRQRGRHGRGHLHRALPHPEAGVESQSAYTNTCPRAPYRGPWQFETYFREQAVDVLARQMGIDPLDLRRRNVIHRDELPYTLPLGLPLVDVSPEETLEQAAA